MLNSLLGWHGRSIALVLLLHGWRLQECFFCRITVRKYWKMFLCSMLVWHRPVSYITEVPRECSMLSGLHPTTLDSGVPGSSSQLSRKGLSSLRFLRARSIELVLLVHGWNLQEGFGGMKTNNHTVFLCYPSEAIYGLWRETRKKSVNGSGAVKVDKKHTVQRYCVILCAMLICH